MSESCLFRYLKKIGLSVLITMAFVMNGLIGSVITAYAENTVVSESNEDITDDGGVNYYIFGILKDQYIWTSMMQEMTQEKTWNMLEL